MNQFDVELTIKISVNEETLRVKWTVTTLRFFNLKQI